MYKYFSYETNFVTNTNFNYKKNNEIREFIKFY